MVTIFIWSFTILPPSLTWLAPALSLVGTFLFWLAAAMLLRLLLVTVLSWLTRHTDSEIDDVIMDASTGPLTLLVLLVGMFISLPRLGFGGLAERLGEKAVGVAVIVVVSVWVWRLFREVVIFYGRRFVELTESGLDYVLLPIANQLGPLFIFIAGALVALQYLGVELSGLLVAIGGASFILAFALQDILSNIFSGLALVVDTPFAYRDLVVLSDGTVCEVRRIGLRVTELYNINSHSIIYVPNSQLATERLVNITRPSPDLIDTLPVTVDMGTDLERARELFASIMLGHPDVLGDLDQKLAHLPAFGSLEAGEAKRENGRARLELEQRLDERLEGIRARLDRLVSRARTLKKNGLTQAEAQRLEAEFLPILADFGVSVETLPHKRGRQRHVCVYNSDPKSLLGIVHEWITVWACDPDLGGNEDTRLDIAALWDEVIDDPLNDHQLLVKQWNRRMRLLVNRLGYLRTKFADPRGVEQRLDGLLLELLAWLRTSFKEPVVAWKAPDVNFLGVNEKGLGFGLEFFIDDIELEHFERQERVRRELETEIVRRLRAEGIGLPFPQQIITIRRLPAVGGRLLD
jgi:MscS family membrane protein